MIAKNNKNQIKRYLAINEVSILRQSRQAASLSISMARKSYKKVSLWWCISVYSAGSTAYNLSVHGPILSLNSKKLSISPISPFRPRRWKGKIVSDKSKITIINLNPKKRPISAVADNIEVRNAKYINIKTNQKIKFNLLYDKNKSLQKNKNWAITKRNFLMVPPHGSNRGPIDYKSIALPAELQGHAQ